jgi:hypothetical protein
MPYGATYNELTNSGPDEWIHRKNPELHQRALYDIWKKMAKTLIMTIMKDSI